MFSLSSFFKSWTARIVSHSTTTFKWTVFFDIYCQQTIRAVGRKCGNLLSLCAKGQNFLEISIQSTRSLFNSRIHKFWISHFRSTIKSNPEVNCDSDAYISPILTFGAQFRCDLKLYYCPKKTMSFSKRRLKQKKNFNFWKSNLLTKRTEPALAAQSLLQDDCGGPGCEVLCDCCMYTPTRAPTA